MTSAAARSTFPLLEIGDGVFQVAATNGDTHLGGDDWDNRLMDWIIDEFKKDTGIDLSNQPDAVQRIKEESEKAKIALSSTQEYEINLPFVTADQTGPKHIQKKLTRSKLEQLTDDLFRAYRQAGQGLLERCEMEREYRRRAGACRRYDADAESHRDGPLPHRQGASQGS